MWSFETDPEFQASLDWIDEFTKNEIEPLDLVFRQPGDPWDPNSPAFAHSGVLIGSSSDW